jgi:hypothetical protein
MRSGLRRNDDRLAPAGYLKEPGDALSEAFQTIADARSGASGRRFRAERMRRANRSLGDFLRRMATYPDRIRAGTFYGMKEPPTSHLFDHIRLYNRNGSPFAAIFHPYARLDLAELRALTEWAAAVGLNLIIDADSEYYPGVTLRIVLCREGSEFPGEDLC